MTSAPTINHPSYHADYQALREQFSLSSPAWLNDLRAAAWDSFDTKGFPTARRGNEPWKYTNVRPIAQGQFGPPALSQSLPPASQPFSNFPESWLNLVFVDGRPVSTPQLANGVSRYAGPIPRLR